MFLTARIPPRPQAAEWSNVISDGADWASASESGTAPSAFTDPFEMDGLDDLDDDAFGEQDGLTARSAVSAASSVSATSTASSKCSSSAARTAGASTRTADQGEFEISPAPPSQAPDAHRQPQPFQKPAFMSSTTMAATSEQDGMHSDVPMPLMSRDGCDGTQPGGPSSGEVQHA